MSNQSPVDFFVSYTGKDYKMAQWIAQTLESAGYTTIIQIWDFLPGGNFVLDMHRATINSKRTIAVLSQDYMDAMYPQAEWSEAFVDDPIGKFRSLIPIRISKLNLEGLFKSIVYIDLVDKDEAEAKTILLTKINAIVKGWRLKPSEPIEFPGKTSVAQITSPSLPNRNRNFSGRDERLYQLRLTLTSKRVAVLYGLGGMGKSQIATEYAYMYSTDSDQYQYVLWLHAENQNVLSMEYAGLAELLGLPQSQAPEIAVKIQAVKNWLEQHTGWLLVFDNAEIPGHINEYIPRSNTGHIVITSQNPSWGALAEGIEVTPFTPLKSVQFLQKRTKADDFEAAQKLAEMLGYLPLALEQAGAYIEAMGISFGAYIQLFNKQLKALWKDELQYAPLEYGKTIEVTFNLAIKAAEKIDPKAREILNLAAFYNPDEIPLELLIEPTKNQRQSSISEAIGSGGMARLAAEMTLTKALGALRKYSLIDRKGNLISIHRLVQTLVREELGSSKANWLKKAIVNTLRCIPTNNELLAKNFFFFITEDARRLGHTIVSLYEQTQSIQLKPQEALCILGYFAAAFLQAQNQQKQALPIIRHTLQMYIGLSEQDWATLVGLYTELSISLSAQGENQENLRMKREIVQILKGRSSSEPSEVEALIIGMLKLAGHLFNDKEKQEASLIMEDAIKLQQQYALVTPRVLYEIAVCSLLCGNSEVAKAYATDVLNIWLRDPNSNQLSIAHTYRLLAVIASDNQNTEEALSYVERAFTLLRPIYPSTYTEIVLLEELRYEILSRAANSKQ